MYSAKTSVRASVDRSVVHCVQGVCPGPLPPYPLCTVQGIQPWPQSTELWCTVLARNSSRASTVRSVMHSAWTLAWISIDRCMVRCVQGIQPSPRKSDPWCSVSKEFNPCLYQASLASNVSVVMLCGRGIQPELLPPDSWCTVLKEYPGLYRQNRIALISVQIRPYTDWVVGRSGVAIQHRSSSRLFCGRPF